MILYVSCENILNGIKCICVYPCFATQTNSIRQAIKLRKDLFMDIWPNHYIEENHEEDGASEEE